MMNKNSVVPTLAISAAAATAGVALYMYKKKSHAEPRLNDSAPGKGVEKEAPVGENSRAATAVETVSTEETSAPQTVNSPSAPAEDTAAIAAPALMDNPKTNAPETAAVLESLETASSAKKAAIADTVESVLDQVHEISAANDKKEAAKPASKPSTSEPPFPAMNNAETKGPQEGTKDATTIEASDQESAKQAPSALSENSDPNSTSIDGPQSNDAPSELSKDANDKTVTENQEEAEKKNVSAEITDASLATVAPAAKEPAEQASSPDDKDTEPIAEAEAKEANKEELNDLWAFLQKELSVRKCAGCSVVEAEGQKFRECAKCRSVLYCNRECQKKNWKLHKKVCCK